MKQAVTYFFFSGIHEILKVMIENGATDAEMESVARNVRSFEKERKRANMVENISNQLHNFGATDDKINDVKTFFLWYITTFQEDPRIFFLNEDTVSTCIRYGEKSQNKKAVRQFPCRQI
jgi:hypothetical protein